MNIIERNKAAAQASSIEPHQTWSGLNYLDCVAHDMLRRRMILSYTYILNRSQTVEENIKRHKETWQLKDLVEAYFDRTEHHLSFLSARLTAAGLDNVHFKAK